MRKHIFPGEVNSPVRSFKYVGLSPLTIDRASGNKLITLDGRVLTDYVLSWGAAILGHSNKYVIAEIENAFKKGLNFGLNNIYEEKLGQLIKEAVPSIELLRFVNSGTEAAMVAVRLARAYTARAKIIKFNGAYHGYYDSFVVSSGSGLATFSIPASTGLFHNVEKETIVLEFNDWEALNTAFSKFGEQIAAVIVEPIMGNVGVLKPERGFLRFLRDITAKYGSLLIFDEVITGFRFHFGAYHNLVGVQPDLICLGKIVGGGLPIGVVGGARKVMELLAPLGPVYQAGTFSGNPVVCAAGFATLSVLKNNPEYYKHLQQLTQQLSAELCDNEKIQVAYEGGMFSLFYGRSIPKNKKELDALDVSWFNGFYRKLLSDGILFPPSPYEAVFVSVEHTPEDIKHLAKNIKKYIKEVEK